MAATQPQHLHQQQNQAEHNQQQQVQAQTHGRAQQIYNQHHEYVWKSFSSLDNAHLKDVVVCFFIQNLLLNL